MRFLEKQEHSDSVWIRSGLLSRPDYSQREPVPSCAHTRPYRPGPPLPPPSGKNAPAEAPPLQRRRGLSAAAAAPSSGGANGCSSDCSPLAHDGAMVTNCRSPYMREHQLQQFIKLRNSLRGCHARVCQAWFCQPETAFAQATMQANVCWATSFPLQRERTQSCWHDYIRALAVDRSGNVRSEETGKCRHCRVLNPSRCLPAGSRCPARLCHGQPRPNPALAGAEWQKLPLEGSNRLTGAYWSGLKGTTLHRPGLRATAADVAATGIASPKARAPKGLDETG